MVMLRILKGLYPWNQSFVTNGVAYYTQNWARLFITTPQLNYIYSTRQRASMVYLKWIKWLQGWENMAKGVESVIHNHNWLGRDEIDPVAKVWGRERPFS
jgi:hypothetical protein